MTLVFDDGQVQLYHGDYREVLASLQVRADLICVDPPYAETALPWDRWPDGWPALVAEHASSMWCFGSMRMFLDRRDEFAAWRLSQDVVWEKHNGSSFRSDRFRRIHEHALHWYRGPWNDVHHQPQRGPRPHDVDKSRGGYRQAPHLHDASPIAYVDDGTRLLTSVLRATPPRDGLNTTGKPTALLEPLISYGCPPGGLVLDPFAGSCSTLVAARNLGRRAVGIEMRAEQCESAVRRLEQGVLALEGL